MTTRVALPQANLLKYEVYYNSHGGIDKATWGQLLQDAKIATLDDSRTLRYPSNGRVDNFDIDVMDCLKALSACELLLIDLAIPTANIRHPLEALRIALNKFFAQEIPNLPAIIVVIPTTLLELDAFFYDIDTDGPLHGKVCALISTGEIKGKITRVTQQELPVLSDSIKPIINEEGTWKAYQQIRAHLLRRRGVFIDKSPEKQNLFYRFQYIIEPDAYGAILKLVISLAKEVDPSSIIVDTTSSFWMKEIANRLKSLGEYQVIVRNACDDLTDEESTDLESDSHLGDRPLILCGVTSKGGIAERIIQTMALNPQTCDIHRAAIICDVKEKTPDDKRVDFSRIWRTTDLEKGTWNYLIPAEIDTLHKDSWQVRAAENLGEITDLGVDNSSIQIELLKRMEPSSQGFPLSNVGLWDILSSVPIEKEFLPQSSHRQERDLQMLPKLSAINPFDANWLAEIAILRFLRLLGQDSPSRRTLTIIVPKSPSSTSTAAELVLDAMLKTRDVKGLLIRRETLFNDQSPLDSSKQRDIKLWNEDKFLLFDESSISLGTMSSLKELLSECKVTVFAYGTIFDVLIPIREEVNLQNFALFRWIPKQDRMKVLEKKDG